MNIENKIKLMSQQKGLGVGVMAKQTLRRIKTVGVEQERAQAT